MIWFGEHLYLLPICMTVMIAFVIFVRAILRQQVEYSHWTTTSAPRDLPSISEFHRVPTPAPPPARAITLPGYGPAIRPLRAEQPKMYCPNCGQLRGINNKCAVCRGGSANGLLLGCGEVDLTLHWDGSSVRQKIFITDVKRELIAGAREKVSIDAKVVAPVQGHWD